MLGTIGLGNPTWDLLAANKNPTTATLKPKQKGREYIFKTRRVLQQGGDRKWPAEPEV